MVVGDGAVVPPAHRVQLGAWLLRVLVLQRAVHHGAAGRGRRRIHARERGRGVGGGVGGGVASRVVWRGEGWSGVVCVEKRG